jgi:hypothetical protein
MTDSWMGGYHLQSYFLFIGKEVSQSVLKIIGSEFLRNWRTKRAVVHRGERKLTLKLLNAGISIESVYPVREVFPNHYKWVNIYTEGSRKLYTLNPPFRKKNSR